MLRAIGFTLEHRGPHGLPRAGFSDWDDTLNVDHGSGKAESVWCGMQFCRAARDLAELADELGRGDEAQRLRAHADEMAAAVERARLGRRLVRARVRRRRPADRRRRRGAAPDQHEPADLVRDRRGRTAGTRRAGAARRWTSSWRPTSASRSSGPRTTAATARVRGTSTYPPGAKENGGIFCHANAWAIVAAAMHGQDDRAYDYYRRILPLRRTDSDRFLAEPYVYCQNICGPAHPQFGMGRNAWLTGTAAWTYVAATQWILGIRPTYRGLRVAPALPSGWPGFTRDARASAARSTRSRSSASGAGDAVALVVDGVPVAGDVVPGRADRRRSTRRSDGRLVTGAGAGAFPADFVWGVATSAYQIEGAAHEDGRGESIWDRFCRDPGRSSTATTADVACDHYHRYRDDVALMRELGIGAYRFSIAWPRVLPDGRGAVERAGPRLLRPPGRRAARGGHRARSPRCTTGTCRRRSRTRRLAERATTATRSPSTPRPCAARLGDRVRHWITHNEPWCVPRSATAGGEHAPGRARPRGRRSRPRHHLLLSHGLAVAGAPRATPPGAEVGIALNLVAGLPGVRLAGRPRGGAARSTASSTAGSSIRCFRGALSRRTCSSDSRGRRTAASSDGDLDADLARRSTSSASTTTRARSSGRARTAGRAIARRRRAGPERTDMGWEVYPDGLRDLLMRLARRLRRRRRSTSPRTAPPIADVREHDGRVRDPERVRVPARATSPPPQRASRRACPSRLLRLVAARQLRVGAGLREALRARLRRLPDARAHPQGQLRPVPGPDPGAALARGGERNGRTGLSRSAHRPAGGAACRRPRALPAPSRLRQEVVRVGQLERAVGVARP